MTALARGGLYKSGPMPHADGMGLVLLHGRGGSGLEILKMGEALGLPGLSLVAPHNPDQSWWPTSFLARAEALETHLILGLNDVDAAVFELELMGMKRSNIGLAGFSQGACLALEYAARKGGPWAGVYGFSGALVGQGDTGPPMPGLYGHRDKHFDYATRLDGVPVRISLHAEDPHIPLARARRSAEVLRARGANVDLDVAPGAGHGFLPGDIPALRARFNTG